MREWESDPEMVCDSQARVVQCWERESAGGCEQGTVASVMLINAWLCAGEALESFNGATADRWVRNLCGLIDMEPHCRT